MQPRYILMSAAATAIRRTLIAHAHAFRSLTCGAAPRRVFLDAANLGIEECAELLIAVDDALGRLETLDARQARVVECRFFGGMTEEETAEALGIGLRTVKREWAKAKHWLHKEIAAERSA